MTWEEWVNSEYNVEGFYIDNDHITNGNYMCVFIGGSLKETNKLDLIIPNKYYYLQSVDEPAG
jgi:hypothetical protein